MECMPVGRRPLNHERNCMIEYNVSEDVLKLFRRLKPNRQKLLKDRMAEYEVACRLSSGPDFRRSHHWHVKARELENRLLVAIGGHGPKAKG